MQKEIHFWAKTTQDGKPGLSVHDHMVNVGCVARCIVDLSPKLLERFKLNAPIVGALAALHDIGKISPGFQRKCEAWLEENGLQNIDGVCRWNASMEPDHGKVSHSVIQKFLKEVGFDGVTATYLSAILGGHHGKLNPPNERGYQIDKMISEDQSLNCSSDIDWNGERNHHAHSIWLHFMGDEQAVTTIEDDYILWWLGGLTSVADWIGSDERFFAPSRATEEYDPNNQARKALEEIGFLPPSLIQGLSFKDAFGFEPNDMQKKAFATISSPGVYVIEAPMGMGKTEAALYAAYNLMQEGRVSGIYFALPTQATSNRIHIRMNKFLQRILPNPQKSRLIHGNSWLMDIDYGIHPTATMKKESAGEDARTGRDWFASTKRAIIAPFGVGTVDQALLGVVAAKHFFVRQFALAGKVVVIDEVHSYDLYTGTLVDKLIKTLEGLGCTVIVLTATLAGKRRNQIASDNHLDTEVDKLPYPLITGRMEGEAFEPVPAKPPDEKEINVVFIDVETSTQKAIDVAKQGGAVIWICNTISSAQTQFRRFKDLSPSEFPIGLLHARFPFWRREELEKEWMERFGKEQTTRCGSILVSTQVVEQSVDLDADLMITELAPTDMILQRLGRLWRHERNTRPLRQAQLMIIEESKTLDEFKAMSSREIITALGGKAKVYAPFVLLRSLEVWKSATNPIVIPTHIRTLIERTYQDREEKIESWDRLSHEWFGSDIAIKFEATKAAILWKAPLEDEEGVQTRMNEMPTVSLVLCRDADKQQIEFIDGTRVRLSQEDFVLSTAQAIHRNLVKVPEYRFERVGKHTAFEKYLFGKQTIGIVTESGYVDVHGLANNIRFFYSNECGLVIEKSN